MKRVSFIVAAALSLAAYAQPTALLYNLADADIPSIEVGEAHDASESSVRAGLPHFAQNVREGRPTTVAFLGGSITNGNLCYRLQISKYLAEKYPDVDFTWVNAGVDGTGTDLGAFRLDEQVLAYNPDIVFIEFSVNGAYTPAMEGIIRKIQQHNPDTDICLLYSASEPQLADYQKGKFPKVVLEEERLAEHYSLPSIHLASKVAALVADSTVIWRGKAEDTPEGKIVFSTDGLHPVREGGNLYAAALARGLDKCLSAKKLPSRPLLPTPLYGTEWDNAKSYRPADVVMRHGLWIDVEAAKDGRMKKFAKWFDNVMTSSHPNSTFSFAFDGDMFGLFDIGGPEMGQLEIYVDGMMVRLKQMTEGGFSYYQATPMTGTHYVNRFNKYCGGRYRGQHVVVKVDSGVHQVTVKLSESKADKAKILGDNTSDLFANPDKYDKTYLMLGRLLIRGELAETKPIKGLPKMTQQLKWEKKINDYGERDEEQSALDDVTLVVGSSSIDMWKSLEEDFPGKNVVRRGVSGTKAIDLYNYREQLIAPFNPKRIIIYEGDNELGFKWEVEEMMEAMKKLFYEVRRMRPGAEIFFVSVKPSPRRAKDLAKMQAFNAALKEFADSQANTGYIDIHTPMLNADGTVRPELFLDDGLHPSGSGYDIWRREFGKVIK